MKNGFSGLGKIKLYWNKVLGVEWKPPSTPPWGREAQRTLLELEGREGEEEEDALGAEGRRQGATRRWVGGSRTRSGEQGQTAQRRAAHGPVGLGVAAKCSSGCALGPLRDRDAKHPSAGSGFRGLPGQAGRDLHAGEGLVQEGEECSRALGGTNRTGGS